MTFLTGYEIYELLFYKLSVAISILFLEMHFSICIFTLICFLFIIQLIFILSMFSKSKNENGSIMIFKKFPCVAYDF